MNDEDLERKAAKVRVRRGPWSPAEDRKLLDIITVYGPSNWVRISISLGSRSPKQCRERYHQNLKPSLNRNPITYEEGLLIEQLVAKHGKKWAVIARHLTGRSDNAIKNWWNGGVNRRRRRASFEGFVSGKPPADTETQPTNQSGATRNGSVSAHNAAHNVPTTVSSHKVPTHTVPAHTVSTHTVPTHAVPTHTLPVSHAVPSVGGHAGPVPGHPAYYMEHHPLAYSAVPEPLAHLPPPGSGPKLPQIDFNTSIFNSSKRNSLSYPPLQPLTAPANGAVPIGSKPDISRSISMDNTPLQPLPSFSKARFSESRRHSLNLAPLVPTSPAVYSVPNSHFSVHGVPEHPDLGSRNSSLSLYDYAGNRSLPMSGSTASSALNSRRASVAPDSFKYAGSSPKYSGLSGDYSRNSHSSSSLSSGDAQPKEIGGEKIPTFKNLMKSISASPQEDDPEASKRMSVASLMN